MERNYESLSVEVVDAVAVVTLKGVDEQHRYATVRGLYEDLCQLAEEVRDSPDIRALVVTGTDDIFSLGDVPATTATHVSSTHGRRRSDLAKNVGRRYIREIPRHRRSRHHRPKRSRPRGHRHIRAVERHHRCRAACRSARRARAAWVSDGDRHLWTRSVGLMKARRYLLTSDRLSAREAQRIGLYTEVGRGESPARATEYATKLASCSPDAVGGTRRALNQWLKAAFPTVFDPGLVVEFLTQTMSGVDHEGLEPLQLKELVKVRATR